MIHIQDKWKGKWVLVTGGSDRVGKGICEYLAARGLHLIIHARTDRPSLHALREALERDYGAKAKTVTGELTDKAAVKAIFEACSPDAVVNNAAVFKAGDEAENMAANLDAPLLVTNAAINRMRRDGKGGVIFLVGDAFVERGGEYPEDLGGYIRSKVWIRKAVDDFAPLGKEGIRVLGIMNGPIDPPETASPEAIAAIAAEINMPSEALGPWIGGWRIGEAIYFALNAEAVAGVIFADGGRIPVAPAPSEQ